jgi:uncharacterized protein with von Willebrand factor type A (vWA) domain
MSSALSGTTMEAAKGIAASVERLEKLFDKLYADTFSMMKDTVSDMRKHIWPDNKASGDELNQTIEKKADEKVGKLKQEIDKDLNRLLQGQKTTEANIGSVQKEMRDLIDKAIKASRSAEIEAREETMRDQLLQVLRDLKRKKPDVRAIELVEAMGGCSPVRLREELKKLQEEGLVDVAYQESKNKFTPATKIRLL